MDGIRQYILRLLIAAIICAIINDWVGSKGNNGKLIKLLCGVFMTVTLLSPVIKLELNRITEYFEEMSFEAEAAVAYGEEIAADSMAAIIKDRTETYILDKAALLELNLEVEVTLSKSNPPVPEFVILKGAASPHGKRQLKEYISKELGISEDRQKWI